MHLVLLRSPSVCLGRTSPVTSRVMAALATPGLLGVALDRWGVTTAAAVRGLLEDVVGDSEELEKQVVGV